MCKSSQCLKFRPAPSGLALPLGDMRQVAQWANTGPGSGNSSFLPLLPHDLEVFSLLWEDRSVCMSQSLSCPVLLPQMRWRVQQQSGHKMAAKLASPYGVEGGALASGSKMSPAASLSLIHCFPFVFLSFLPAVEERRPIQWESPFLTAPGVCQPLCRLVWVHASGAFSVPPGPRALQRPSVCAT